jgi:hypothetical protein
MRDHLMLAQKAQESEEQATDEQATDEPPDEGGAGDDTATGSA